MIVNPVAEFDELHVISDLHIGGIPGFQIFGSGPFSQCSSITFARVGRSSRRARDQWRHGGLPRRTQRRLFRSSERRRETETHR
jgi:hypothetical protein